MRGRRRGAGYTLFEVAVVVAIVLVIAGLALPGVWKSSLAEARDESLRFASVLRWLAERGAHGARRYRIRVDLAEGEYRCEVLNGDRFEPVSDPMLGSHRLARGSGGLAWITPVPGPAEASIVVVEFDAFGPSTPILFQFPDRSGERGYTVAFLPEEAGPRVVDALQGWAEVLSGGSGWTR